MNQKQKDDAIAIVSNALLHCHYLATDITSRPPTAKESKGAYQVNPVVNNLTNAVVLGIDTVLKEGEGFCEWGEGISDKEEREYISGCGKYYYMTWNNGRLTESDDRGLKNNHIKFCCFCGLKIKEVG